MKIIDVKSLEIPEVKVIRFSRFCDDRGFFSEPFRKSDFAGDSRTAFLHGLEFRQMNESHSKASVIRGLHFQWNPYMGKLVRTISGRMVDIFLDIRKGSKTFGLASMYDLPEDKGAEYSEWIWVPPGFAHGNFFPSESRIEYLCSGEYSPGCEAGISPLAQDINWDLCPRELLNEFSRLKRGSPLITDKDRNGHSVAGWKNDQRSDNFKF